MSLSNKLSLKSEENWDSNWQFSKNLYCIPFFPSPPPPPSLGLVDASLVSKLTVIIWEYFATAEKKKPKKKKYKRKRCYGELIILAFVHRLISGLNLLFDVYRYALPPFTICYPHPCPPCIGPPGTGTEN